MISCVQRQKDWGFLLVCYCRIQFHLPLKKNKIRCFTRGALKAAIFFPQNILKAFDPDRCIHIKQRLKNCNELKIPFTQFSDIQHSSLKMTNTTKSQNN